MKDDTLIELACQVSGTSIISIDAVSEVKLTGGKNNPHQGRITKVSSKVRGILFENTDGYHNLIKNKLLEEGIDPSTYEPGERRWGEHIDNTPLITHNGNVYLQMVVTGVGEVQYRCDDVPVTYDEQGMMVDKDGYFITGLPAKQPQPEGGIILRIYKAQSILEARAFGKVWR